MAIGAIADRYERMAKVGLTVTHPDEVTQEQLSVGLRVGVARLVLMSSQVRSRPGHPDNPLHL